MPIWEWVRERSTSQATLPLPLVLAILLNPSSIFASETPERTYFYRFTQAGIYTLAFGAINIWDYPLTSALLVSNVAITPRSLLVPESNSALAMITLGIVGGGLLFRRHLNSMRQLL